MQVLPSVEFGLSSELCALLAAFESAGSMTKLAQIMGRDPSVISRQLSRASRLAPVLEKRKGQWRLSSLGSQIASWAHEAAAMQQQILHQQTTLRIASTREFAARVLSPQLSWLLEGERMRVLVLTAETGVEAMLLSGQADLGFDCGSPEDPSVRYRRVTAEAFSAVAAPAFLRHYRARRRQDLLALPHLQYQRASAPRLLHLSYEMPNIVATFNDIASIREACVAGLGWAVLPLYAVRRELKRGELKRLPHWKIENEQFGVWWMRDRRDLESWAKRASDWLSRQSLV